MLVSCLNKLSQTQRLTTRDIYSLTVLEARSQKSSITRPKPRCQQGCAHSGGSRGESGFSLSQLLGGYQHIPWLVTTSLQSSSTFKPLCPSPIMRSQTALSLSLETVHMDSAPAGPPSLFLQQCSDGADPGMPFLPASNHPPNFCPGATFRIIFLPTLCLWDQPTPYFKLGSLLPINRELPDLSELFQHDGGLYQPPGPHASSGLSYTYLSLGFYFHHYDVPLEGVGHLFWESATKYKDAERLLKMQNQHSGHPLFQGMQKPSQDEWGKTLDSMEAAMVLENLNRPLLGLHALGPARVDVRDCVENHFRDEEGTFTKEMGDQTPPTHVRRLASPQAWLSSSSSKGLHSSMTRSLWSPAAFEGPLWHLPGAQAHA
uniref:Ferritin light chain n=1 Tax=Felis catus TaxID=9685 RepID=A0ABI8A6Z3_FELCA